MKPYIYLTGTHITPMEQIADKLQPEFDVAWSDGDNPVASRLRLRNARAVIYYRANPDEIAAMECALASEWGIPVFVTGVGVNPEGALYGWLRHHTTGAWRDPKWIVKAFKEDLLLPHEREVAQVSDVISTHLGNGGYNLAQKGGDCSPLYDTRSGEVQMRRIKPTPNETGII